MPAQTEYQMKNKSAVEHVDPDPSPQTKEPAQKKAVNLLKDMDTDNISDNASNYTMFLVNSTNARATQQQNQDQKRLCGSGDGYVARVATTASHKTQTDAVFSGFAPEGTSETL